MGHYKKPAIAARWNPIRFQLTVSEPLIQLPFYYVYAVATQDSVYIYTTQQSTPIAYVSQLHYSTFTDLAWSSDGTVLVLTSTDGFGSLVVFEDRELGEPFAMMEETMTEIKENIQLAQNPLVHAPNHQTEPQTKKRRIVPTLVHV